MTKAEKQAYVDELTSQLGTVKAAVFTEYLGTTVAQMDQLRGTMYEKRIGYKVAKNSLLKRVLKNASIEVTDETILDKPMAIATGMDDEVITAKTVMQVGKEIETVVPLGGIVNGKFVGADVIRRLAALPGREELLGKMVGSLAGLPTRMVRTIANPMTGLVTALNQAKAQKEG
jgi:large subunit ribosomal protein L10